MPTTNNWPPTAIDGRETDMSQSLKKFAVLQGHVTRAKNNLLQTLAQADLTQDSIQHAINSLEQKLNTYHETQVDIAALCCDADQVDVLEKRVNSVVTDADADIRKAVTKKANLGLPATPASVISKGPKKVSFRDLDHDNVRFWIRQVEDLFDTMGIISQLNRFTTLTTLLSASEATVIQDLTMSEPRPDDVFDQAKILLFARYDRPIHERLTRAITMGSFEPDELPSQWLARFRQLRGKCEIDDLDRWALMRQMPSVLHPTLDAIRPEPALDAFVKHCDRLIKTLTSSASQVNVTSDNDTYMDGQNTYHVNKSRQSNNSNARRQNIICWFHKRFSAKAHTCEGTWCSMYTEGLTIRKYCRSGNGQGERQ